MMNLQFIDNSPMINVHQNLLHERLKTHSSTFHPVVKFDAKNEILIKLDFTKRNQELQFVDVADTNLFSVYVDDKLKQSNAKFGIGGYNELRELYSRSEVFDTSNEEPRRLHLGVDIWGEEGTTVYAPLNGIVHSCAFNDNFGDYGATIILKHDLQDVSFYTLYGHLSLADINCISANQSVEKGAVIAHFGSPHENGNWPPHLHFQIINDIEDYKGDYPGVCKESERDKYLSNCPDPDLILNLMQHAKSEQTGK